MISYIACRESNNGGVPARSRFTQFLFGRRRLEGRELIHCCCQIVGLPHPLKLGKEVLEPYGGDGKRGGEAAPPGVLAGVERLEVRSRELARDPPDVEVDVARRRG